MTVRPAIREPASGTRLATAPDALLGCRRALPALRDRRLERGLTLKQLADAGGLSFSRLGQLEHGVGITLSSKASAIAEELHADLDDLFGPPLLARSEVAELKGCDPHTVADAIASGDLPRDGNRVPLAAALAWSPRKRGGQRRLKERECHYRECGKPFKPRHAEHRYCPGTNHGALEREARKREQLAIAAEARGGVALGRAGRRAARRYGLDLMQSDIDGYSITPVFLAAEHLPRFEQERTNARDRQLDGLRPRWDSLREQHRVAGEAQRAYCTSLRLWTVPQAAAWLPCSLPFLDHLIERGSIPVSEEKNFGGGLRRLVKEIDVRSYAASRRGRQIRRDWLRWALRRGASIDVAQKIAADAGRRAMNADRTRAGNPKPSPMRKHHDRWRTMAARFADEDGPYGYDYVECRVRTRQDVLREVFLDDWQAHPEAWPRKEWPASPREPSCPAEETARRACRRIDLALRRTP